MKKLVYFVFVLVVLAIIILHSIASVHTVKSTGNRINELANKIEFNLN